MDLYVLHPSSRLFSFASLFYLASSTSFPTPYLSALHPLYLACPCNEHLQSQHGFPPSSHHQPTFLSVTSTDSFSLLTPPPFRSASPPPLQPADWTPLFLQAYARFCRRVSKNTRGPLIGPFFCSIFQRYAAHCFPSTPSPLSRIHITALSVPKGIRTRLHRYGRTGFCSRANYHISFIQFHLCVRPAFVSKCLPQLHRDPTMHTQNPQQPNSSRCQAHAGHSLTCLIPRFRLLSL